MQTTPGGPKGSWCHAFATSCRRRYRRKKSQFDDSTPARMAWCWLRGGGSSSKPLLVPSFGVVAALCSSVMANVVVMVFVWMWARPDRIAPYPVFKYVSVILLTATACLGGLVTADYWPIRLAVFMVVGAVIVNSFVIPAWKLLKVDQPVQ